MFSTELAEIVLIVEDVERSARFNREVVVLTPENDWAWFWADEPGRTQRLALHKSPLLFEERSPLPQGARWGNTHYAFNVPRERLEVAVAHVDENDTGIHGPVYFDWMKALSYYFGNLLEFWSPDPTEAQRRATHAG
ncbi:MAG TPA: hypothetical protein VJ827_01205 [Rubrobacter sp.]|nr:hypothetical protein [Rubrobacter sp.]